MSMETDRIEADLRDSRHRLSDTLDAIGTKLSPGQMLDEVLGLAQGQAGHLTANLGRQVRDNPLPAVLIVAGAALLLLNKGGRSSDGRHDEERDQRHHLLEQARAQTMRLSGESEEAFDDRLHMAYAKALEVKQSAGEAVSDFKRRVGEMVGHAKHAAAGAGNRVSHAMSDATHHLRDQGRHLGRDAAHTAHQVQNLYRDTPLAAGGIAVAIGALIGSATPLTNVERDGLGEIADRATRATGGLAAKGARAAKDSLTDAVH